MSGSRSPWRVAIAGLFLAPAVALAATQVYPDLISGFVMAVIVMIMATVELRLKLTTSRLVVVALSFVVLPWLDQKNILLALLLLVAWVILWMRTRGPWSQLRWVVVPTLVGLVGLVALNLYSFGHLLGFQQPISLVSVNTWTRAVALLVDRRQGLFTQLPVAVLGVAGLWTMRRRLPIAVVTSLVVLAATIYGNATQEISFGGGSLAGRFQWPTLPLLLGFAGLFLLELWRVRRRATGAVVVGIGALFAMQLVPIVRNEHILYNQIGWDPITYTGWWGGLDPSPVLGYIGGVTLHDLVPAGHQADGDRRNHRHYRPVGQRPGPMGAGLPGTGRRHVHLRAGPPVGPTMATPDPGDRCGDGGDRAHLGHDAVLVLPAPRTGDVPGLGYALDHGGHARNLRRGQ